MCRQMRLDKLLYQEDKIIRDWEFKDLEGVRKASVRADLQYDQNRKALELGMSEMDRIGPVISMLFKHLTAVRAGAANPIEDALDPTE